MLLAPVILAGGSGTRLWPLSRELYPKQLLAFSGGHTLLQETACRVEGLDAAAPLVVCAEESRFLVREQLEEAGKLPSAMILEPMGRNTAPALTLAAIELAARHGDALMLVLPADHVITDNVAFRRAVSSGAPLAANGSIVTFGVVPGTPDTGYGYIRQGAALEHGAFSIDAFTEKPDAATAVQYLRTGGYLWNSGMFMMTASAWLGAITALRPAILSAAREAYAATMRDGLFMHIGASAFAACPSDSIDYAVMEKLPAAGIAGAVLPLAAGWSDAGSWPALWDILEKDGNRNAVRGDVFTHQTTNSLIFSETRLTAALGLDDVIIIETADAVLVAKKSHAQQVRAVVEWLKGEQRQEHISHQRVFRPWGYYQVIDAGERYKVKRIMVKPGRKLSLQKHNRRAEHWIVVKGRAAVTCGDAVFELLENQSTYIPIGAAHRLENPGADPLEMIEVQSGGYLGEDDIVRIEDEYNRS